MNDFSNILQGSLYLQKLVHKDQSLSALLHFDLLPWKPKEALSKEKNSP